MPFRNVKYLNSGDAGPNYSDVTLEYDPDGDMVLVRVHSAERGQSVALTCAQLHDLQTRITELLHVGQARGVVELSPPRQ
jgi:hypothetical protein